MSKKKKVVKKDFADLLLEERQRQERESKGRKKKLEELEE